MSTKTLFMYAVFPFHPVVWPSPYYDPDYFCNYCCQYNQPPPCQPHQGMVCYNSCYNCNCDNCNICHSCNNCHKCDSHCSHHTALVIKKGFDFIVTKKNISKLLFFRSPLACQRTPGNNRYLLQWLITNYGLYFQHEYSSTTLML